MKLLDQLKQGQETAKDAKLEFKPDKIIFCGMGGSIIPAEIISMLWLPDLNCYLNRTAYLPHWASKNHLVICTSWSGNTEETNLCFAEAIEKNIPAAAITKGGELRKLAEKNNQLLIIIPEENVAACPHTITSENLKNNLSRSDNHLFGVGARFGVGYMLASILTLLSNSDIIENTLFESLDLPPDLPKGKSGILDFVINSSNLNKIGTLIYSSYPWRYLAGFWKVFFNESCKIHSFSNYFPAAAHNEIVGFNNVQKNYFPIILIDPDENSNDIRKLKKFSSFLKTKNIEHEIIELKGKSRLEKIFNNYNLIIEVSNELAKNLGVDPMDSSTIEEFKNLK